MMFFCLLALGFSTGHAQAPTVYSQEKKQFAPIEALLKEKGQSQDAFFYTNILPFDLGKTVRRSYPSPYHIHQRAIWNQKESAFSDEQVNDIFTKKGPLFGENLRPIDLSALRTNANFDARQSLGCAGIILHHVLLKRVPTSSCAFQSSLVPGEGYPFDQFIMSVQYAGTPVWISHASKDGLFVYVECADRSGGFVPSHSVAVVTPKQQPQKIHLYVWTKDNVPIVCPSGVWQPSRIGMPAWVVSHMGNRATILCPTGKTKNGVVWEPATVATHHLSIHSARDQATVTPLCQQLASDIFAWGGSINGRDCSLLVRDYCAAAFNQFVPRNSMAQMQSPCFNTIDLTGLSWAEKKKKIMAHGVPFQSFVYMPGHMSLYIGTRGAEPVFLQNAWAYRTCVNTPDEGRIVIGRAFFSDWEKWENMQNRASCLMTLKKVEWWSDKPDTVDSDTQCQKEPLPANHYLCKRLR
jgi:cell wall-associated NlpC family hydrolase